MKFITNIAKKKTKQKNQQQQKTYKYSNIFYKTSAEITHMFGKKMHFCQMIFYTQ